MDDPNSVIPIVARRLWVRAPDQLRRSKLSKGDTSRRALLQIPNAIKSPRPYIFRTSIWLVCITFSKILDSIKTDKSEMDCNLGEIYALPAFLDDVEILLGN